jgi:hypothetical protein
VLLLPEDGVAFGVADADDAAEDEAAGPLSRPRAFRDAAVEFHVPLDVSYVSAERDTLAGLLDLSRAKNEKMRWTRTNNAHPGTLTGFASWVRPAVRLAG